MAARRVTRLPLDLGPDAVDFAGDRFGVPADPAPREPRQMRLVIDGEEVDFTFHEDSTVLDVLQRLQAQHVSVYDHSGFTARDSLKTESGEFMYDNMRLRDFTPNCHCTILKVRRTAERPPSVPGYGTQTLRLEHPVLPKPVIITIPGQTTMLEINQMLQSPHLVFHNGMVPMPYDADGRNLKTCITHMPVPAGSQYGPKELTLLYDAAADHKHKKRADCDCGCVQRWVRSLWFYSEVEITVRQLHQETGVEEATATDLKVLVDTQTTVADFMTGVGEDFGYYSSELGFNVDEDNYGIWKWGSQLLEWSKDEPVLKYWSKDPVIWTGPFLLPRVGHKFEWQDGLVDEEGHTYSRQVQVPVHVPNPVTLE